MNETERLQDEELVMFTDSLLGGQEEAEASRPALAETVEVLARVVSPQPPPERLRRKIKQQIAVEWRRQQPSLGQRLLDALKLPARQPARRLAWAAVAAVALLVVAASVLAPAGGTGLAATVTGDAGMVVGLAVLVLLGVLVVGWLVGRGRK